jgi:SAM-dependent methyltransferase
MSRTGVLQHAEVKPLASVRELTQSADMKYALNDIPIDAASFKQRADRTKYLVAHFGRYLIGSVLDVGCDMALLRDMLPDGTPYTGVDIGGKPDLRLNLEEVEVLPFEDGAFNAVVCTDVLEHLDNLHAMFEELLRVSKRYLIVSLPNNWANARRPLARGHGAIGHYGLPTERPIDRHKWFFGLSDATTFLEERARKHNIEIAEMRVTDKPRSFLVTVVLRLFGGSRERYLNRYAHTLWAVMEKTEEVPIAKGTATDSSER